MTVSLTGYSMPIFWWGLLLILLFSVQLGWTPVSGRVSVQYYIEPTTGFLLIDHCCPARRARSRRPGSIWSCPRSCWAPTRWPSSRG